MKAFSPHKRPDMAGVALDAAWRGQLPVSHLLAHHPAFTGKPGIGHRPCDRYSKVAKIPQNGICPACKLIKPATDQWITRIGFIPICLKCWHRGKRLKTIQDIAPAMIPRHVIESRVLHTNKHGDGLTPQERRERIKFAMLLRLCGNPPQCWRCGRHVPTASTAHRKLGVHNKPGRRWIVVRGFFPTCRTCWQSGARKFLDNLSELG